MLLDLQKLCGPLGSADDTHKQNDAVVTETGRWHVF